MREKQDKNATSPTKKGGNRNSQDLTDEYGTANIDLKGPKEEAKSPTKKVLKRKKTLVIEPAKEIELEIISHISKTRFLNDIIQ